MLYRAMLVDSNFVLQNSLSCNGVTFCIFAPILCSAYNATVMLLTFGYNIV